MAQILIVEDEPLILMDLEMAAEDAGLTCLTATGVAAGLAVVEAYGATLTCAVLDVSLGPVETCLPIARALEGRGIPYVIHSGDLDRHDETIRLVNAARIAKPARAEDVIAAAMALAASSGRNWQAGQQ